MNKKQLLLDLFNAESSLKVHEIVVRYGLNSSENWHPYGDNQNNAGTFENQQSSPENALVEKLTNSVDAILMKHCYVKGLDPKSKTDSRVPQDMDEARKDIEMDEYVVREVQDKLNEAVEFSFRYYGNFLMTFEDVSD